MEKRKFLRLRLKIRLSCSDLHYIFHILNSIGGPLGPMVQTSPSAQSDRSRTIKKIIKPVWTNGPLDRSGPVVLSLGADHRAPWHSKRCLTYLQGWIPLKGGEKGVSLLKQKNA